MSILSKKDDVIQSLTGTKCVAKTNGEYWFYDDAGSVTYVIANRAPLNTDNSSKGVIYGTKWFDTTDIDQAFYYCSSAAEANWSMYYTAQEAYDVAYDVFVGLGSCTNNGSVYLTSGAAVLGTLHTLPTDWDALVITPPINAESRYYHTGASTVAIAVTLDNSGSEFEQSVGSVFYLTCGQMQSISLLSWYSMASCIINSLPSALSGGQTVEVRCVDSNVLAVRVY